MDEASLIEAIKAAMVPDEGVYPGISCRELSNKLQWSLRRTRRGLRLLIDTGQAEYCGLKPGRSIDTKLVWVPMYRLTEKSSVSQE
jgi:hypothetical protein